MGLEGVWMSLTARGGRSSRNPIFTGISADLSNKFDVLAPVMLMRAVGLGARYMDKERGPLAVTGAPEPEL